MGCLAVLLTHSLQPLLLQPAVQHLTPLSADHNLLQALFMLVNLGIPDLLLSGPRSADDLAANIGPAVHPDRLARALDFAAAFGMINRKRIRCKVTPKPQKPAAAGTAMKPAAAGRGVAAPASSNAISQLKEGLLEAEGSNTGDCGLKMHHRYRACRLYNLVACCDQRYRSFSQLWSCYAALACLTWLYNCTCTGFGGAVGWVDWCV